MRLCPSVEGSPSPLITHRIGVDVCMARQRTFFHKCHRCVYRGKAADWQAEPSPLVMNVHTAEEPSRADVVEVDLAPARARSAKAAKAKAGKPEKQDKKPRRPRHAAAEQAAEVQS